MYTDYKVIYRFRNTRSRDYRTLEKAKIKINFVRMSLVKNLNWVSETGRTMPNKMFFC